MRKSVWENVLGMIDGISASVDPTDRALITC